MHSLRFLMVQDGSAHASGSQWKEFTSTQNVRRWLPILVKFNLTLSMIERSIIALSLFENTIEAFLPERHRPAEAHRAHFPSHSFLS